MSGRVWCGFVVFVLMTASRWLLATAFPSELPPLFEESLHELAIGLAVGVAAWRSGDRLSNGKLIFKTGTYGALLIALPSIVSSLKRGGVSGLSGLALLTLVPAIVAITQAQTADDFGLEESARGMLLPALAGAGGAFLLIPVRIPSSLTGELWLTSLALCTIPVGLACVRLPGLLRQMSVLSGTAIVMLACGLVEGAFTTVGGIEWSLRSGLREIAICALIDAPLALLLVWLLRKMEPLRFSSRFQLIPITSILEGMMMVRPTLTLTTALGVLLMLAGGIFLLMDRDGVRSEESASGLGLK